jgi:hypothetical protein
VSEPNELPCPNRLVVGAESILDATRTPMWLLRLKCGHFFYAPSRFRPGCEPPEGSIIGPPHPSTLLPPPKTATCLDCGRKIAGLPPKYDPHLPPEMAKALHEHGSKLQIEKIPGGVIASVPNAVVPADSPAGKSALAGGPPGPLGVTVEGVHVIECPRCKNEGSGDCDDCGGTGTLPPVIPGKLLSDFYLGFWFHCDGAYDAFSLIVCRGRGWVGWMKERRHGTPWKQAIFRPSREWTADRVIADFCRKHEEHLRHAAETNFDNVKRWAAWMDVRSNEPARVNRSFTTFMSLIGAHAIPEGGLETL